MADPIKLLILLTALGIYYEFGLAGTPQMGLGVAFLFYFFLNAIWNRDDVRPIPIFGREPDVVTASGVLVPKAKVDPMLVHAAYSNDALERRHKLNVKTGNLKWGLFGTILLLSFILSFAAVFYTYYFGINVNCALHTKACP